MIVTMNPLTGAQMTLKRPIRAAKRGNRFAGLLWAQIERRGLADRVANVIRQLSNNDACLALAAKEELAGFWSYEINVSATGRFGQCGSPSSLRPSGFISISDALLRADAADEFVETFLHEIAHALVHIFFKRRVRRAISSHGREWAYVMRLFGLKPARCGSNETAAGKALMERKMAKARYVYACDRCDLKLPRIKPLNLARKYTHKGCGGHIVRAP